MVNMVLAWPMGVSWNSVRRYTGARAACQSWQWIMSGIQFMKFRAARAALEKKQNLGMSPMMEV